MELQLRAIKIELPTGASEVLLTSILNETITATDFDLLYQMRWGVEEKYKEYKCRIENQKFTGTSVLSVMQDFFATIAFSNLTSFLIKEADKLKKPVNRKFDYKINATEALAATKAILRKLIYGNSYLQMAEFLIEDISNFYEPVRKGRVYPRDKSNKSLLCNFWYPRLS